MVLKCVDFVQVTQDGIANTVAFWFELQMENPKDEQQAQDTVDNSNSDDDSFDDVASDPSPPPRNDARSAEPKSDAKAATISTAPSCLAAAREHQSFKRSGEHWLQAVQVNHR